MRRLGRWALRVLLAIAVISLATFVVDLAVFKLRGSPHSTVAVSQFMEIPLKERTSGVRLCGDHERALRRSAVSAGRAGSLLVCQAASKSVGKAGNAGVLRSELAEVAVSALRIAPDFANREDRAHTACRSHSASNLILLRVFCFFAPIVFHADLIPCRARPLTGFSTRAGPSSGRFLHSCQTMPMRPRCFPASNVLLNTDRISPTEHDRRPRMPAATHCRR